MSSINMGLLGKGTYGTVYRVKFDDEIFAVKCFEQEIHFRRELKALKDISNAGKNVGTKADPEQGGHKNVLQLAKFNQIKKELVFPLMRCDLAAAIREGKLSVEDVLHIAYGILSALVYLHGCGFIHLDLKPSNVLLSFENVPKIADFGTATRANEPTKPLCVTTQCYKAPELLFRKADYNEKVDIWSVGCIVVEMCNRARFIKAEAGKEDEFYADQIVRKLGRPSADTWPEVEDLVGYQTFSGTWADCQCEQLTVEISIEFDDLHIILDPLLTLNPADRPSASKALADMHSLFFETTSTSTSLLPTSGIKATSFSTTTTTSLPTNSMISLPTASSLKRFAESESKYQPEPPFKAPRTSTSTTTSSSTFAVDGFSSAIATPFSTGGDSSSCVAVVPCKALSTQIAHPAQPGVAIGLSLIEGYRLELDLQKAELESIYQTEYVVGTIEFLTPTFAAIPLIGTNTMSVRAEISTDLYSHMNFARGQLVTVLASMRKSGPPVDIGSVAVIETIDNFREKTTTIVVRVEMTPISESDAPGVGDKLECTVHKRFNEPEYRRTIKAFSRAEQTIKDNSAAHIGFYVFFGLKPAEKPYLNAVTKNSLLDEYRTKFGMELNNGQVEALVAARHDPVSVIHGPPGTGKTLLLLLHTTSLAQQLKQEKSESYIFMTAPTNNVCADFAKRLLDLDESIDVTLLQSRVEEQSCEENPPPFSLLHKVSHRFLNSNAQGDSVWSQLKRQYLDASSPLLSSFRRASEKLWDVAERHVLGESTVICSTLISSGDNRLVDMAKSRRCEGVIIDEAAQANAYQTLMPLMFCSPPRNIVSAGDPCQLPPYSLNGDYRLLGMSLFNLLVESRNVQKVFLTEQRRMAPIIADLLSRLFYDCKLKTATHVLSRDLSVGLRGWYNPQRPLVWFGPSRAITVRKSGTSSYNPWQIRAACQLVTLFLARGVPATGIAVVSPYRAHTKRVSALVRKEHPTFPAHSQIWTINTCQGREAAVVIYCDVQATSFTSRNHLNVACSRAIDVLAILGDPKPYLQKPKTDPMRIILKHAEATNCLFAWSYPNSYNVRLYPAVHRKNPFWPNLCRRCLLNLLPRTISTYCATVQNMTVCEVSQLFKEHTERKVEQTQKEKWDAQLYEDVEKDLEQEDCDLKGTSTHTSLGPLADSDGLHDKELEDGEVFEDLKPEPRPALKRADEKTDEEIRSISLKSNATNKLRQWEKCQCGGRNEVHFHARSSLAIPRATLNALLENIVGGVVLLRGLLFEDALQALQDFVVEDVEFRG